MSDVSGNEDNGAITLTATLDHAVQGGFTVDVNTADGTAKTSDNDYSSITGHTLTFVGNAGETQTFTILPTSDTKLESDETVVISMNNLSSTTLGVDITDGATATIVNDDNAKVTMSDVSGNEDNGAITLTATLDHAVQGGFTVDVNTADGTAKTSDNDYSSITGHTLTFVGNAGETQTFTILPTSDTKLESDETVVISMNNLSSTTLGVDITDGATATIVNDDNAKVTMSDVSGNEDNGAITLTATLDHAVQGGFTVDVNTADGTAKTSDNDYSSITGHTLTFVGNAGETQTFTILPTSDTKLESDETVVISMNNLSSTTLGVDITDGATATIVNDDNAKVTMSDVSGNEDNGAITLTATLDHAVQGGFTVDVNTADGTAKTSDNDYSSITGHTLTFVGNAGETQTFTILPTSDTKLESDETVVISMNNLSSTTLGVDITDGATATIVNDDNAKVTMSDVSGNEDNGAITLTATLDHAVQGGFTVDVNTADGTAKTSDNDYSSITGHTLTFVGNAGETQTFTILPTSDTKLESDETVVISMNNLSSTTLGVDITDGATATIVNDDNAKVTMSDVSVNEDVALGVATFTITLNNDVQDEFSVDYSTSDETAFNGSDYTSTSGTISFPADSHGGDVQTFTVPVINDNYIEKPEYFIVTLSNITGSVTIGTVTATGTITDDDAAIVSIDDLQLNEDDPTGQLTFTITLTGALQDAFSIDFATADGSATVADNDYVASSGTLIFNPGESTKTITVTVNPDKKAETDEVFTIELTNPTIDGRNITVDPASGSGTILNDDHAPVVSDIVKTGNEDNNVIFADTDFTSKYVDADNDPLVSIKVVSLPTNGVLYLGNNPVVADQVIPVAQLSAISFRPSSDWFGSTSFNYNAIDGVNWAVLDARVTITISSVNDDPIAVDDYKSTPEDTPAIGSVITNDSDVDGDNLVVTQFVINGSTYQAGILATIKDVGTLNIGQNGAFTFTPALNYNGTVPIISYTIGDGNGGYDVGDLFITVNNINDAPILFDENLIVCSNEVLTGNILSNGDVDPDGTSLTVNTTPLIAPAHGTLSISENGRFTYTPQTGYNGSDLIVLSVCDNGTPLPAACANDTMHIAIVHATLVNAGADATITKGSEYLLGYASVLNANSQIWTTSGSGTFSDATKVNPIYYPSYTDILAGNVTLKLSAAGTSPCGDVNDFVVLTFSIDVAVNAGEDAVVCGGSSYKLSTATSANTSQVVWSTSGTGTFDDEKLLNATYTPSAEDLKKGQVVLTITAFYQSTSEVENDSMTLTFGPKPSVNAGNDQTACSGEIVSLKGASAQNYTTIIWTTSGKGTLSGANTLTSSYTPSKGESGIVKMIAMVSGAGSCDSQMASDTVLVRYHELVEVDAGDDITTPNNTSVVLTAVVNPSAGNYTYSWSPAASVVNPNSSSTETIALISDTQFIVTVTNVETGCQARDTVTVTIENDDNKILNIRNGISPNGDGNNDIWRIDGIEKYTENTVEIFNRWGDKIIEFRNYDNDNVAWDGRNRNGKLVPDGTYYYLIKIPNEKSFTGWIQLRSGRK